MSSNIQYFIVIPETGRLVRLPEFVVDVGRSQGVSFSCIIPKAVTVEPDQEITVVSSDYKKHIVVTWFATMASSDRLVRGKVLDEETITDEEEIAEIQRATA